MEVPRSGRETIADPPQDSDGTSGYHRNGNGALTKHRLSELERRMTTLEGKVDGLVQTCTRIATTLDGLAGNMADKGYVLRWFGIVLVVFILTLVGHVAVRAWIP